MAKTAVRQVSIFINGKEVENTIKSIAAEQVKLNNTLKGMTRGTEEYENQVKELQKVNGIITEHNQKLRGVQQGWSLAKVGIDKLVGVAAGAFAVSSIVSYGKELFGVGVKMDALQRKAEVVFGTSLPQVTAEAEKNAKAIGLTTAQYVSAAAAIQDLLIPMGFQRQEAAGISTQLVNLSGALSEWTGGQVSSTDVSHILTKALLGEREELKQLGISISDADVKAQLAAKGLDKLTGSALEQAKASATLELVLAKSTDAQAAFAKGGDSAVRRQAELAARTAEVAEKLSTLLLPVFEALASIASAVIGGIGGIVGAIGDLIDPADAASRAFDNQSKKVNDLQNNIAPLLDRYDVLTTKTNLNKSEQGELKTIIEKVSAVIPTAISGFDAYGNALGLNTTKAREFIEVEKARLKFVNESAIKENEAFVKEIKRQQQEINDQLGTGQKDIAVRGAGGEVTTKKRNVNAEEIQALQASAAKLQETLTGANAELSRLKGENLNAPSAPPESPGNGVTGNANNNKAEIERIQKELTDLIERTTSLRLDLISKEQDDELAIAIRGIEKRYDAEIAKAIELEGKGVKEATAQRIVLEKLKQEEIGLVVQAGIEKDIADAEAYEKKKQEAELKAYEETLKFLDEKKAERAQFEAEIKQFEQDNLLTEQQQELLKLEEHYATLLTYAQKNGIDTLELTRAYETSKTAIVKEQGKQRIESEKAVAAAQRDLEITKANAIAEGASIVAGLLEESSGIAKGLFLVEKAASAISVILSLQKEKAAIYAATRLGTLFDPTGAVSLALATPQIIAANIRGGINLATIAATTIKGFVKQKATGGVLPVTGADDGRQYNARSIGTPSTGLLPHYPVVFNSNATNAPVLASERGAEYFVASQDLQRPYVANLVRMIDLATHGGRGIPQFADGGVNTTATSPTPLPSAPPEMMAIFVQATAAINTLNALLRGGIIAVVPDGTVLDINQRFAKLNAISGGYFQ
jgi:hypothetical protein